MSVYDVSEGINVVWGIAGSMEQYYVNPDAPATRKLSPSSNSEALPIARQDGFEPLRPNRHVALVYRIPRAGGLATQVLVEFFGRDVQVTYVESDAETMFSEFDVAQYHQRGIVALNTIHLGAANTGLQRPPTAILVDPTINEMLRYVPRELVMHPPVANALFSKRSTHMRDDGVVRYSPNYAEILGCK